MAALLVAAGGVPARCGDAPVVFTDVAAAAGIEFVESIGDDRMTNIVESTGAGCGFLDFDGDGWMDIYLVNGCWREGLSDPKLAPAMRASLVSATDRLYRNRGDGTFEDVTIAAGLNLPGYGMGVVAADYDGDGDQDVYVTNYGPNFLYRNNGDGTFAEVAKAAGIDEPRFSVGAVFLDYDRNGRLDLYVGNYLTYDVSATPVHSRDVVRSPLAYSAQPDRLFRGNGDGTFTDVSREAGVAVQDAGRAMGVGTLDVDGDGWLDVFVSNDAMENFLFRNKGNGSFENAALLAGVAFSEAGAGTAAMAVEVADYDADSLFDILVPDMNLCCLYHNLGGGLFEDASVRAGLGAALHSQHSWGAVLADFDLDGDCDAYVANGDALSLSGQENKLFVNSGHGRFTAVAENPAEAAAPKRTSRGVARGDFDNDGDVDLLVNNLNDRPALLRNDSPRRGHRWLTVELRGPPGNRDALGAVVLVTAGGRRQVQPRISAGSYLCQHDPRLHFGLGKHDKVDRLEVVWPDGSRQAQNLVPADRRLVVSWRNGSETQPAD